MVEGPLVHSTAAIHRVLLLGKAFGATSPSGRFTEGAAAISGRYLSLIEVHGKNIFYFFTRQELKKAVLRTLPDDVVVVRIHFGMSGSFGTYGFPGPEPREKTRLRLQSKDEQVDAHLTASVCVHGDMEIYRETIARLGPDPLRGDADKEMMWQKIQTTRKTIGSVLLDQSRVAGIGNMYRAEILFFSGLHPDQRASTLSRPTFENLWEQSVRILRLGLAIGSIVTISPDDAGSPYHQEKKSNGRGYVYMQSICNVCASPIRRWPSGGRTIYACEVCQPLKEMRDKGVGRTLADNAFIREGGYISTEANVEADVTVSPGMMNSSFPTRKITKSVIDSKRARVVVDEMDHHRFKVTGALRDFSSRLPGLGRARYDFSTLATGSSRISTSQRTRLPGKYRPQASESGRVVHERNSRCPWETFTNQFFPTIRVGYITMQALGTVRPQARLGLQAVSTLSLGSSSPMLMLSARLSHAFPLLHL